MQSNQKLFYKMGGKYLWNVFFNLSIASHLPDIWPFYQMWHKISKTSMADGLSQGFTEIILQIRSHI